MHKKLQIYPRDLNEIINRKSEMKIRNNDKSINIILKISQITEEFNSTKQKYIETKMNCMPKE